METTESFLYQSIYESLHSEIDAGLYAPGDLLPSEREICERFQVKRGTARKALRLLVDNGFVEKQAGVGSRVAQPVKEADVYTARACTIGLILADDSTNERKLSQPYYADLFNHIEQECRRSDCQLIYASNTQSSALKEFLRSQRFSSVIFVTRTSQASIELAQSCGVPLLLVNERHAGMTSISYDGSQGAFRAVEYLVQAGHHNIAFITGPDSYYTSVDKLNGCYNAIMRFGLDIPPANITAGNWEYQGGYEKALELFRDRSPADRPTALFVFNDIMSIGAVKALRELGLSVPSDVSVIGFDNMEQLRYTEPDLTTVDTNISEMAKVIVRYATHPALFVSLPALRIKVETQLICRGTVAPTRHSVP